MIKVIRIQAAKNIRARLRVSDPGLTPVPHLLCTLLSLHVFCRVIQILQFGSSTDFIRVYPNGTFEEGQFFPEKAFISPRFFAWSGSSGDYNMFSLLTNYTNGGYSNWAGLRLSFSPIDNSNYVA